MWYNGKKKRPGCIRSPGLHLTTFYENGLRLNRIALSKKSDSAEHPSQTAYVLDDVQERRKVVIHLIGTVHTAIDGNEPDIVLREKDLRTETYFQIVSSDSAHAHGKKNTDLVCFYHGDHALPFRTVEVGTGKTVVHKKLDFAETLFFCVFLENRLLIDNAVALSCLLVITTQAAIDTPLLYMAWE